MAQLHLDFGTSEPGDGETLRTAFPKIEANFGELYAIAQATQPSKLAIASANIDPSIDMLQTLGYTSPGDGGRSSYIRADAEPSHAGKVQSADGQWWELAPIPDNANVHCFGAVGDGVTDDIGAMQACVDWAIYFANLRVVSAPAENYRTTNTLHLGYGVGGDLVAITLEGSGSRLDPSDANQSGTCIELDATDRMAINFQGVRHGRLRNITVRGQYRYIASNNLGFAFNDNDWDEATWKDPDWAASGFLPYSVYAGVTVDAYSGAAPGTGYPTVSYPAWLGVVAQYGKAMSRDVLIDDADVLDWVVCVAGHPCQENANGEFIRWHGGVARALRGFCVGHSQSRLPSCVDVDFQQCYVAIDHSYVGNGIGQGQGVYQGCHFEGCWQIVKATGGWSTSIVLRDCYGETNGRLGEVSGADSSYSLVVDGCTFAFREISSEKYGVPASHCAGASVKLRFTGGTVLETRYGFIIDLSGTGNGAVLDDVHSVFLSAGNDGLPDAFEHGTGGFLITATSVDHRLSCYLSSAALHRVDANGWTGTYAPYFARRFKWSNGGSSSVGARTSYEVPDIAIYGSNGQTLTLANRSDKSVDISSSSPTARLAYRPGGGILPLDIGDAIRIGGAWFVVTGFASNIVHLTQVNNYRRADADDSFVNKSVSDASNAAVQGVIFSRVMAPSQLLVGTVGTSSQTISNVKAALSDGDQWSGAPNGLAANDWLMLSEAPEAVQLGTVSGNRLRQISSIDTGAKTITFVEFFDFGATPTFLPFWIKTLTA